MTNESRGMAMIDKLNDALRFQQAALELRARRQEVLASNIANADTPNFKARDIDFASALRSALAGSGAGTLDRTSPGHLAAAGTAVLAAPLQYRTELQASIDGNTVNLDVERGQFSDNAVRYEAALTFISGYLRTMQTAIQGQ